METIDFCRAAYRSADKYYNYLRNTKQGRSIINVRYIEYVGKNKFKLYMTKKAPFPDSLVVNLHSLNGPIEFDEKEVSIVEYNEIKMTVNIIAGNRATQMLSTAHPDDITLESDLTFLVKAVREWYNKHHKEIATPPAPSFPVEQISRPERASDEQFNAINSVLSSPISYVWGAPGTGKTQMVLANCIMEYIRCGQCVLLMAPTNNALEQSLRGIIKSLDENGISRKKIIRLGKATSEFVTQYPEVCMPGYYDSLFESLKQEIDSLKIESVKQQRFAYLKNLYPEFSEAYKSHTKLMEEQEALHSTLSDVQSMQEKYSKELTDATSHHDSCFNEVKELQALLKKQSRYFLLVDNYAHYSEIIEKYDSIIANLLSELRSSEISQVSLSAAISRFATKLSEKEYQLLSLLNLHSSLVSKIKFIFSKTAKDEAQSAINTCRQDLNQVQFELNYNKELLSQLNQKIDLLNDKISHEKEKRAFDSELMQISRDIFGASLSYEDIKRAFADELRNYDGFKPDDSLSEKITSAEHKFKTAQEKLSSAQQKYSESVQMSDNCISSIAQTNEAVDEIEKKLLQISGKAFDRALTPDELYEQFHSIFDDSPQYDDTVDFEKLISKKEQEYENILLNLKNIFNTHSVIACTVDYAHLHYDLLSGVSTGKLAHLFMDEAAYCSIIKAGVAFSFNIPVAMFGDHMQLPPICEMDKSAIVGVMENNDLCLWDMSALYFPDIFSEYTDMFSVFDSYENNLSPQFNNVATTFLTKTFRFGESLATILDKHIYHNNFSGNPDLSLKISVIDAPRTGSCTNNRESHAEARAIAQYLKSHKTNDYTIIAPYKDQCRIIEKECSLSPGSVHTIHAAQGREWDTVIISVTDAQRIWFMSSKIKKSNGLRIVNTAVSRARKNLVFVLDYNAWKDRDNELITDIVNSCTEFLSQIPTERTPNGKITKHGTA